MKKGARLQKWCFYLCGPSCLTGSAERRSKSRLELCRDALQEIDWRLENLQVFQKSQSMVYTMGSDKVNDLRLFVLNMDSIRREAKYVCKYH